MFSVSSAHLHYAWLVFASLLAGVMNAMAGGGSFISFPAMLSVGVPPVQANATNTVALWPGQLTALGALRSDVRRDLLPAVATASVVGGVLGAEVLLHTAQRTFLQMIPWLILGGTLIFGVSGRLGRWIHARSTQTNDDDAVRAGGERSIAGFPLTLGLFPVCFYIGYFGAGSGLLTMTVLALFGIENMHALNAMKVVAVTIANGCAVVTFIASGSVVWHDCLISMVFAAAGGYLGARLAKRANGDVLRAFVVVTGVVIAGYFFWRQAQGGP